MVTTQDPSSTDHREDMEQSKIVPRGEGPHLSQEVETGS